MSTGIKPGNTAAEELDLQLTALEILSVHVRYLELTASRRRQGGGDIEHFIVVKIKSGHGVAGLGLSWLLLDTQRPTLRIEVHDPVTLGILHVIGKYGRTLSASSGLL